MCSGSSQKLDSERPTLGVELHEMQERPTARASQNLPDGVGG